MPGVPFFVGIISIHAPHTGSDKNQDHTRRDIINFNPRSPYRERLQISSASMCSYIISIHAPHTGSDQQKNCQSQQKGLFQSTLPIQGATRYLAYTSIPSAGFQSTLPIQGATHLSGPICRRDNNFNPRSPYRERPKLCHRCPLTSYFNPRSPYRERPTGHKGGRGKRKISIHAPHTGSDEGGIMGAVAAMEFQSTLPIQGATALANFGLFRGLFQSTLPIQGATLCR